MRRPIPFSFRRVHLCFIVVAGTLLTVAAYSAVRTATDERALSTLSQDRGFGEVVTALRRLKSALEQSDPASEMQSGTVARRYEELRLRWQALYARSADRMATDPSGILAVIAFDRGLAALQPAIADLARTGDAVASFDAIRSLEGQTGAMFASANSDFDRELELMDQVFDRDFTIFICSSLGFVGCSIALVVLFGRHGRDLRQLARRDNLTGLQNRLTFSEMLAARLQDPDPGQEVGLMLLDVDRFKTINDTLGHAAGDELLKEIARRFRRLAQDGMSVSRLGGDEFAIILSARSAYREATNLAEAIAKVIEAPFCLDGKPVRVSMSIGIASTPLEWCDAATLLRHADIALYTAKGAGRGTFRFFDPKMHRELRSRREIEDDLRQTIETGRIELHFQPIVDLASGEVVRCEALARWRHPRHGNIPPTRFIALAEEIGLINQLGSQILEQACVVAQTWPRHVGVSINLSPCQFDGPGLVAAMARVLEDTGIAPNRVELEITESILRRNDRHVLEVLANLKRLGVGIALDDFGASASSLFSLHRLPIDRIKIDRTVVREISARPETAAAIESINLLAGKLGVITTAEGIETEEHAALLRELGCEEGQGFRFARPLPAEACLSSLGADGLAGLAAA